ncbi:hypothetical protein Tco_0689966 [Tanacetum coccineum]
MKKKDLIRLDKEVALKLQAEFDEEERLAREKAEKEQEANIALIETWDDIQAKIDADHQLAERLQAQEQEELSVEEKATLFQQLLAQEITKKQKVEDDKEISKIKKLIEIIPNEEEVTIDAIPLVVKEDLYKLVKAKFESTKPVEDLDLLLWGDLKTMFEPHVEDAVWRNQQAYKVLDWKLYDSCGGRIVGIKSLLDAVWITAAHVFVNAAQMDLVLLMNFKENMLTEVNAVSENMLGVSAASEYQVNAAS